MVIYFVRHGQTIINQQGRLQGNIDFPLSEQGYNQALLISRWVENLGVCTKVFASDLCRAFETARIISIRNRIPLIPSRLLRERDLYEFELSKYSDVAQIPGRSNIDATVSWDWHKNILHDEILVSRVNYLLNSIEGETNPLLISHAGIITAFIKSWMHLESHVHIPTGSIVEFNLKTKQFNLIVLGEEGSVPVVTKIQGHALK